MKLNLSINQTRVIGVLIEKEITTPDQYPLSLNSLMMGCNQKSNREPVLNFSPEQVQDIIEELKGSRLVTETSGYGARVTKIKHRFCNTEFNDLQFTPQELGIICVLFLRGPQTAGELRIRTNRLCQFTNTQQVEEVLNQLAQQDEPLVIKLPKELGKRDHRWMHLFSGEVQLETQAPSPATSTTDQNHEQRISQLEQQVALLTQKIEYLNEQLGL